MLSKDDARDIIRDELAPIRAELKDIRREVEEIKKDVHNLGLDKVAA
jgi:hypothetical protein